MKRKLIFPFILSTIIIFTIIFINKISFGSILTNFDLSEYSFSNVDEILKNLISLIFITILIYKIKNIKIFHFSFLKSDYKNYIFLIPLLFIYTNGFKSFINFDASSHSSITLITYTLKIFSSAILEEYLFRGLIFGLFFVYFSKTRKDIFTCVIFSNLIFGFAHIINLWSLDYMTFQYVINQMYASFCIGVYFSALYLSSKNLLSLTIAHFIINFFSSLDEINFVENTSVSLENNINNFIGELITITIYSIPLIIGLYIIFKFKKDDIKILNRE